MALASRIARLSFVLLACTSAVTSAHRLRRDVLPQDIRPRALQPSTTQEATVTDSSASAESAVLNDVAQVLEGLSNLPNDLRTFFQLLQGELAPLADELRALLQALGLGGLSTPATSNSSSIGIPVGFPVTSYTPSPTNTVTVTQRSRSSRTAPVKPSKSTIKSITTIRRTSTIHITRTVIATSSLPSTMSPSASRSAVASNISLVTMLSSTILNPTPVPQPSAFLPNATNNIAAYYNMWNAPDANTTMDSLQLLCDEPAINIINLAWVETFVGTQYGAPPTFGIAFPCGEINCTAVGYQASICQQKGKQVFISLVVNSTHMVSPVSGGGASSNGSGTVGLLGSGEWAQNFAAGLISTFGPSVSMNNPNGGSFGNLVVDGFDIYPISSFPVNTTSLTPGANTTNIFLTTPYDVQFIKALRQQLSTQARTYYISAAPYCGDSESPLSLEALRLVDFVYVRYLDTPGCSLKDPSLDLGQSLHQWSSDLLGLTNGPGSTPAEFPGPGSSDAVDNGPRLFFGGLAPNGSVELNNNTVQRWENLYRYLNPTNAPDQGGVMLWGAPEDIERKGRNGRTFATYVKGQIGCLDSEFRSVPCGSLSG